MPFITTPHKVHSLTSRSMVAALFTAAAVLIGCGDKAKPTESVQVPASATMAAPMPDVGTLETVNVSAQGFGPTADAAVAEAMKLAILQVNGASIQSESMSASYGLDVTVGKDSASLRATEFADVVKQRSKGVINNFRITELVEPSKDGNGRFKVTISADIAKFKPSAEMQKIKIVVGTIRFPTATVSMGDRSVSATEAGAILKQRISDALVQTGRFAVLDREISPEIENELNMISSGQSPSAELAKLSQAASADIVWSAKVSQYAYNRFAKQLKTSDRQLVSYSGGWALTHKLVNVATRQVMLSDSIKGGAPATEATTLSMGVDGGKVQEGMNNDIVNQVVTSVLRKTFPVTVLSVDGDKVILSQGGASLKVHSRYRIAQLGNEMKDPQTGQSLGRTEAECCQVVIDQVTPNLSYGHLENVKTDVSKLLPGALQVRDLIGSVAAQASNPPVSDVAAQGQQSDGKASKTKPSNKLNLGAPASNDAVKAKTDDKW